MPDSPSMPDRNSERDLIARTRAGDAGALADIYATHASQLLTVATRISGSRADAEDILHDLFVGLPEALRRYDERGTFAAWLRKITARMALMRLRSDRRRSELNREAAAEIREHDAGTGIENRALEEAIQALSPALRTVFLLRTVEGYSHREIADLLKISTSASEARLSRAIAALRASLKEYPRWS